MLSVKILGLSIIFQLFLMGPGYAKDIFYDSFETGDLGKTNVNGFKWTRSKRTSVVNSNYETFVDYKKSYNSKLTAAFFAGGDWTAKSGKYSLRFAYPAGQAFSERRFNLGKPMKELWIRFWLRVPVNLTFGPKGRVNKLFSLWTDAYSAKGDGSTIWLGFHKKNSTDASYAITYSEGGYNKSIRYQQNRVFFTAADRGRWMHLVIHIKSESQPGASDGKLQTYRKWGDETTYELEHDAQNLPLKVPSNKMTDGFLRGYILGWANAAYKDDTEWLVDDFSVSDASPISN